MTGKLEADFSIGTIPLRYDWATLRIGYITYWYTVFTLYKVSVSLVPFFGYSEKVLGYFIWTTFFGQIGRVAEIRFPPNFTQMTPR